VARVIAQGFTLAASNTRRDSHYLKPEGCAFALRISNHARTPKQRKNHPDAITSLVIRTPQTEASVDALVEQALRNFFGARRVMDASRASDIKNESLI
jgi:hypothetical protein